jgi:signal transduction histidine kinase
VVEVQDDGLGIATNDLDRVGARFFRSEAARVNQVPGTGLGLAVARSIVEEHGGDLRLASPPGGGTRATVRLPLTAHARVRTG